MASLKRTNLDDTNLTHLPKKLRELENYAIDLDWVEQDSNAVWEEVGRLRDLVESGHEWEPKF